MPPDKFIKCLELANLNEMYQIGAAGGRHNVGKYGIVLVGFIFRPADTMEMLEKYGIQDKVIQDIMTNNQAYSSTEYDRQVDSGDPDFLLGPFFLACDAEAFSMCSSKIPKDIHVTN